MTTNNQLNPDIVVTPYDNTVTLLYKIAYFMEVPNRLMIVRPRTLSDVNERFGTNKLVYESLPMIMNRLLLTNMSLPDIMYYVNEYNKQIDKRDILMNYYNLVKQTADAAPGATSDSAQKSIYETVSSAYAEFEDSSIKLENYNDLKHMYEEWIIRMNRSQQLDQQRLENILYVQEQLHEVDKLERIPITPVTINSSIMSFNPTINGRSVTSGDGLDIFNRSIVNRHVPYIRYNDQFGKSYYRVYTGDRVENGPNYSVTVLEDAETKNKDTIYLTLWLGDPDNDPEADITNAPKESFFTVIYRLETNYLTVEAPVGVEGRKTLIRDEELAYARTKAALKFLDFGKGQEVKVRGEFKMLGIKLEENSLLDEILMDLVLAVYLYVEENIKPYALKKRLDIHYRPVSSDVNEGTTVTDDAYISNSASVSITVIPKIAVDAEQVQVLDTRTGKVVLMTLPKESPYIQINVSQAESREVLNEFIPIFQLLMRYYIDTNAKIVETYQYFLPELATLDRKINETKQKTEPTTLTLFDIAKRRTSTHRESILLRKLREHDPEMFPSDYARVCQGAKQPLIVSDQELQQWKQKPVGPSQAERPSMKFPNSADGMNFVCPSDTYPYPGIQKNDKLSNRDAYPYIPCCFKRDQLSVGVNSFYRAYVEDRPRNETGSVDKKITTRKILKPSRRGTLPKSINNLLNRYSDTIIDIVRYGVINSPSSLLHCVMVAIDDKGYISQPIENRDDYVNRVRIHMARSIQPSLMKQEMYDYSEVEIRGIFEDINTFLDPALFYRAIEEFFEVNIYVFDLDAQTGKDIDYGDLEIPRYKTFHAHAKRIHRPTIIIAKTLGSDAEIVDHPQCELIVDYDEENRQVMKMFGEEMTEICHDAMMGALKTLTWVSPYNQIRPDFKVYSNIYYYLDHMSLIKAPILSQYIDQNGKMRALTVQINANQKMTIATIPSQPENLPVSAEIIPVTMEVANSIMGTPVAFSRNNKGQIDGLWYKVLGVEYGEYVMINPLDKLPIELPEGPANPLTSVGISATGRLQKMRRTLDLIVQIVKWLYILAMSKQKINPDQFATAYMVMDTNPVIDSSSYYDLSQMPRRLPAVETATDAIRMLQTKVPTLFSGDRIIMYSPIFADRIVKMLRDYDNLHSGIDRPIPEFLDNYFVSELDFEVVPYSKLFMREADLISWLKSLKSTDNFTKFFNIRHKIEIGMSYDTDPYLYMDDDGRIYIIQNVIGGSFNKAMTVAKNWYQYHVNVGGNPESTDDVPIHMIYGLSNTLSVVPIEDLTNGSEVFLSILYYGSMGDKMLEKAGRYAAMLEIL